MRLTVNNKEVYLKKDTQITLVLNNPDFDSQEKYTFEIEVPYNGCTQNKTIFGNSFKLAYYHSTDTTTVWEARFELTSTQVLVGELFPIAFDEENITMQFISGNTYRSNISDEYFDEMIINRLTIGQDTTATTYNEARKAPVAVLEQVQFAYDSDRETYNQWACQQDKVFVGLRPWVNQNTGTVNNTPLTYSTSGNYAGYERSGCWSLLQMTQVILNKVGYTHDLYDWARSENALLCGFNTLPNSWGMNSNVAKWLPHWTVNEYLQQLEILLGCKFLIDHKARTVVFKTIEAYADERYFAAPVELSDDKVLESFSCEIDDEETTTRGSKMDMWKPFYFSDRDDRQQKYEKAKTVIKYMQDYTHATESVTHVVATNEDVISVLLTHPHYKTFDTLAELYDYCKNDFVGAYNRPASATREQDPLGQLFYVSNVGYFCMRSVKAPTRTPGYTIHNPSDPLDAYNTLQKLWRLPSEPEDNAVECKIVPVCVDDVYEQQSSQDVWFQAPFLPVPEYDGEDEYYWEDAGQAPLLFRYEGDSAQPYTEYLLNKNSAEPEQFFDKIYVGFLCNEMDLKEDFRPSFVNMSQDERPPLGYYRPAAPMIDYFSFGLTNYDIMDLLHHQFFVYVGEQPQYGVRTEKEYIFTGWKLSMNYLLGGREDYLIDFYPNFMTREQFTIYFLSETVPEPQKIYRIANYDYLCASIEVTFNSRTGMNNIVKGVFYPLYD